MPIRTHEPPGPPEHARGRCISCGRECHLRDLYVSPVRRKFTDRILVTRTRNTYACAACYAIAAHTGLCLHALQPVNTAARGTSDSDIRCPVCSPQHDSAARFALGRLTSFATEHGVVIERLGVDSGRIASGFDGVSGTLSDSNRLIGFGCGITGRGPTRGANVATAAATDRIAAPVCSVLAPPCAALWGPAGAWPNPGRAPRYLGFVGQPPRTTVSVARLEAVASAQALYRLLVQPHRPRPSLRPDCYTPERPAPTESGASQSGTTGTTGRRTSLEARQKSPVVWWYHLHGVSCATWADGDSSSFIRSPLATHAARPTPELRARAEGLMTRLVEAGTRVYGAKREFDLDEATWGACLDVVAACLVRGCWVSEAFWAACEAEAGRRHSWSEVLFRHVNRHVGGAGTNPNLRITRAGASGTVTESAAGAGAGAGAGASAGRGCSKKARGRAHLRRHRAKGTMRCPSLGQANEERDEVAALTTSIVLSGERLRLATLRVAGTVVSRLLDSHLPSEATRHKSRCREHPALLRLLEHALRAVAGGGVASHDGDASTGATLGTADAAARTGATPATCDVADALVVTPTSALATAVLSARCFGFVEPNPPRRRPDTTYFPVHGPTRPMGPPPVLLRLEWLLTPPGLRFEHTDSLESEEPAPEPTIDMARRLSGDKAVAIASVPAAAAAGCGAVTATGAGAGAGAGAGSATDTLESDVARAAAAPSQTSGPTGAPFLRVVEVWRLWSTRLLARVWLPLQDAAPRPRPRRGHTRAPTPTRAPRDRRRQAAHRAFTHGWGARYASSEPDACSAGTQFGPDLRCPPQPAYDLAARLSSAFAPDEHRNSRVVRRAVAAAARLVVGLAARAADDIAAGAAVCGSCGCPHVDGPALFPCPPLADPAKWSRRVAGGGVRRSHSVGGGEVAYHGRGMPSRCGCGCRCMELCRVAAAAVGSHLDGCLGMALPTTGVKKDVAPPLLTLRGHRDPVVRDIELRDTCAEVCRSDDSQSYTLVSVGADYRQLPTSASRAPPADAAPAGARGAVASAVQTSKWPLEALQRHAAAMHLVVVSGLTKWIEALGGRLPAPDRSPICHAFRHACRVMQDVAAVRRDTPPWRYSHHLDMVCDPETRASDLVRAYASQDPPGGPGGTVGHEDDSRGGDDGGCGCDGEGSLLDGGGVQAWTAVGDGTRLWWPHHRSQGLPPPLSVAARFTDASQGVLWHALRACLAPALPEVADQLSVSPRSAGRTGRTGTSPLELDACANLLDTVEFCAPLRLCETLQWARQHLRVASALTTAYRLRAPSSMDVRGDDRVTARRSSLLPLSVMRCCSLLEEAPRLLARLREAETQGDSKGDDVECWQHLSYVQARAVWGHLRAAAVEAALASIERPTAYQHPYSTWDKVPCKGQVRAVVRLLRRLSIGAGVSDARMLASTLPRLFAVEDAVGRAVAPPGRPTRLPTPDGRWPAPQWRPQTAPSAKWVVHLLWARRTATQFALAVEVCRQLPTRFHSRLLAELAEYDNMAPGKRERAVLSKLAFRVARRWLGVQGTCVRLVALMQATRPRCWPVLLRRSVSPASPAHLEHLVSDPTGASVPTLASVDGAGMSGEGAHVGTALATRVGGARDGSRQRGCDPLAWLLVHLCSRRAQVAVWRRMHARTTWGTGGGDADTGAAPSGSRLLPPLARRVLSFL